MAPSKQNSTSLCIGGGTEGGGEGSTLGGTLASFPEPGNEANSLQYH